ncbi:MAG: acetyl-CoA carboxylase biotin carboxyl carrier protein subunit [Bacteroidales bacterium]|nr:acetyl-CoA carboxylase biotin carboxyl carrier protein subunit [Bacteroidales bacterium]
MEKRETGKLIIDHTGYTTSLSQRFVSRKPYAPPVPGRIQSFIPGTVVEVLVRPGDTVKEGDDLVILEAMKMKNRLKSHLEGHVVSVNVAPGDRVAKGVVLVEIS